MSCSQFYEKRRMYSLNLFLLLNKKLSYILFYYNTKYASVDPKAVLFESVHLTDYVQEWHICDCDYHYFYLSQWSGMEFGIVQKTAFENAIIKLVKRWQHYFLDALLS